EYEISEELLAQIKKDVGQDVFTDKTFKILTKFSNSRNYSGVNCDKHKFIEQKTVALGISSKTLNDKLNGVKNAEGFDAVIAEYKDENIIAQLKSLKAYFANTNNWPNPIEEYVMRIYLATNRPKFLYYDEYYALPSRISIEHLQNEDLDDEDMKTAKALFDLADINVDELLNSDNYEDFKAELEATQATITDELFKYWGSNKNLEIIFDIDKRTEEVERTVSINGYNSTVKDVKVVEHILDIRVKNRRTGVSLPLKNRSKGFNWFFSFLVWFKKIQEDHTNNYILLLDEPGLNLHASAQNNLLRFLKDLSEDYQIIYTTHSPFMIESHNLEKVRTVLETDSGTIISDSIQEKDPNTLFPLQAALGYDIAQNLFISKHNLLVEGASDLLYLQVMSALLQSLGRTGLNDKITIVPTGGLDKVSTFISLLRGSDLSIVCLLDSFRDVKGKTKLDDLVEHKIINKNKIRFFDEFLEGYTTADIEDLFDKKDYLKFYNEAFGSTIKLEDLNEKIKPILIQLTSYLSIPTFNHYRPANKLASTGVTEKYFNKSTLENFEKVF
ncbi:MAG TPA: AAA family ATPase, partial [Flavobacterium sp.]|nr:AAA family ATPase [Flavobacterium sp.]